MNTEIFRDYDIRGVYGEEITVDIARKVGVICSKIFAGKTFIAHDGRYGSDELSNSVVEGLKEGGVPQSEIIDLGLSATPELYFAVRNGANGGIMITASHNPKEWNGIKILKGDGIFVTGKEILSQIEKND